MVYCQAYGCTNRPETDRIKNVKRNYFVIPNPIREQQRCERWLHNIGTGKNVKTFKFNKNNVVCSDHFHPNCIQEDRMAKTLGYEPKRAVLVPGAVPSIFDHKVFDVINMNGEEVPLADRSSVVMQRNDIITQAEVKLIFIRSGSFSLLGNWLGDVYRVRNYPQMIEEVALVQDTTW